MFIRILYDKEASRGYFCTSDLTKKDWMYFDWINSSIKKKQKKTENTSLAMKNVQESKKKWQ